MSALGIDFYDAPVELCYLDVPVDELWRRLAARGAEHPAISREDLDEGAVQFQPPTADELTRYDRFA
jgi:hypothetical protein